MPDDFFGNGTLVRYESMRVAVAECARIDEASEIKDKAAALAAYARERDDKELEGWVAEIKCRAAVRIGQLSRDLDKGAGRPRKNSSARPEELPTKARALADAGISTSTAHEYEELAEAYDEEPSRAETYYTESKASGIAPTLGGLRHALKWDKRQEREKELATKTAQISRKIGKKLYPVILADPPWRFQPYSRDTGMDRAADNHYPTMTVDKLMELGVATRWAAPDCVLFLWATVPMLPQALDVMKAWGFEYKSHFVWLKDRIGTGYWNRNRHELLLIGTRGKVPAPAQGDQYDSVIPAKVGRHSEKPAAFVEMIDDMFSRLEGIELFARESRTGWDAWGNEVDC
jgi:N6-adenosine-specific RNA methylase IME4